MNHILLLTKSYFHKTKGQTASLIALIMIAVMLLNVGIIMQIGINTFFEERAEGLNAPHIGVVVGHGLADADEMEEFLFNHESIIEMERRDILFDWGNLFIGDNMLGQALILETNDPAITMNPLSLIGDYLPLEGDVIYMPHFLMVENGFEIGDVMSLVFNDEEIWFTVGGSTEEILYGDLMSSGIRFFISDEKFQELQVEFPNAIHPLITARMENPEEDNLFLNELFDVTFTLSEQEGEMPYLPTIFAGAMMNRTFMSTIIGITVIALAGVLLVISAVVVRFRINNNIEESIRNIGVLKAMGYMNKQIIQSILLQFGGLTLVGGIVGIGLTNIVLPFLAQVLEGQIGLIWHPNIDFIFGILTLFVVIGFILILAYLSARRIKKLFPLIALREGITTHNFKKNYFPLEKGKSPLTLLLSFKQLLQSKKQLVMVTLITAGLSFSAVTSLTIYYNLIVNNDAFVNTIGGIVEDVLVFVREDDQIEAVRIHLEEMPEIDVIYGVNMGGAFRGSANEINMTLLNAEDTGYLGSHMLVEGRFPIHANEIAVSPVLINMEAFNIGEAIVMSTHDEEAEFLITGVVQTVQDAGIFAFMTGEAMERLHSDFIFRDLSVRLAPGVDVEKFIEMLEAEKGDLINVFNIRVDAAAQLGGMTETITPVAFGNVAISGVVIILVLYMIMKTMITRRHKELGIQKALGFTNFQLMNQLAMNLLPIIILGTIIGVLAGYFGFNSIFVFLMAGTGIGTADLPTPIVWVIILAVGMVFLSYVAALLISRRIRKISAYALISE